MKTQEHRLERQQHRRLNADLEATIASLFRLCPTLCGFAVRETPDLIRAGNAIRYASRLLVTEVTVDPQPDLHPPAALCREITSALVMLLDECPEVCELLRGRTFARTFH